MKNKKGKIKVVEAVCYHCKKPISIIKDHYVEVSTYNRLMSEDAHDYFHMPCWISYFNGCVERAKAQSQGRMQSQAIMQLLDDPKIQEMMQLVVQSIPKDKNEELKQKIKKKENDRRKKRVARKRKN